MVTEDMEDSSTISLIDETDVECFDSLTTLALNLFQVPVSLVSIIDYENDRQVFKSQTGLAEPWSSRGETPLSHSFCQHVASKGAALCVEDAREHPLVKDNLAIPDLGVIAYLGAPVFDNECMAIGAFCIISGVPRVWTDEDKEVLYRLAKCATDIIKLKTELYRENVLRLKQEKTIALLSEVLTLMS